MSYLEKCRTVNLLEIHREQICGRPDFGQVSKDHLVPGQDIVPIIEETMIIGVLRLSPALCGDT